MFLRRLQGLFIPVVQIEARGKMFGFVRTADYMIFPGVKYIPFHKTAKSE